MNLVPPELQQIVAMASNNHEIEEEGWGYLDLLVATAVGQLEYLGVASKSQIVVRTHESTRAVWAPVGQRLTERVVVGPAS